MRYRIAQFMAGRNGVDSYARFQSIAALVALFISFIVGQIDDGAAATLIATIFFMLGIVLIVICYTRVFSKKLEYRRQQNDGYLRKKARVLGLFSAKKAQFAQRKDYCFFTCPSCKAVMRVPKGKGKVKVVCRKCGEAFIRKT